MGTVEEELLSKMLTAVTPASISFVKFQTSDGYAPGVARSIVSLDDIKYEVQISRVDVG